MGSAMVLWGVVHSSIVTGIVDCGSVRYSAIHLYSPLITGKVLHNTVDIVTDRGIAKRVAKLCTQSKGPLECFCYSETKKVAKRNPMKQPYLWYSKGPSSSG